MYINFFPGNTRDSRILSSDAQEAYGATDIVDLVDSMIVGCTASAPVDGALDAIRDGSIWGDLCAKHGDDAVQDALEELAGVLKGASRIEIALPAGTQPSDWQRLADKRARAAAQDAGIEWAAADVYVTLPEPGRCYTKAPGLTQLQAHG